MRNFILAILIINYVNICFSQNIQSSFIPLKHKETLFNKKTNYIFEDQKGFLWIATTNGLYKYNGYSIDKYQYNVFEENSLPNNNVNSIIQDDYENLWLGSESFLICYHSRTNSFKGFYKGKTSKVLGKSSNGSVWAFIQYTGIIKIEPHSNIEKTVLDSKFNYKNKKPIFNTNTQINHHLEDNYKRNWFATSNGIIALDSLMNKKLTGFNKNTLALCKGMNNNIIAATKNSIYVLGYTKNNYELEILEEYNSTDFPDYKNRIQNINTITVESNSNVLWVGTNNGLLKGIRKNNTYQFSLKNSDSGLENYINTSLIDKFGNLWLGSQRGVNKLIGKTSIFEYHRINKPFENTFTSTIFCENKDQLLIAFKGKGILRYNLNSKKTQRFLTSNQEIGFIKSDYHKKELFIGIGNQLVKTRNYNAENLSPAFDSIKKFKKPIQDMVSVNNNEIWVGLWDGGIEIINAKKGLSDFEKKAIASLSQDNVYIMHLDKLQNIWIGTRGNGLFKVNLLDESIKHFAPKQKEGLLSDAILSIEESKDGDIWIGTRGGSLSLYRVKDKYFQNFGKSEGLPSKTITGIEEDYLGNLWISTDEGISHFDTETKKFKNFGIDEGIKESQFSFKSTNQLNKKLFFGSLGGFYKVSPEKFKKTKLIPNTVITNFSIFGNEMNNESIYNYNEKIKNKLISKEPINLSYQENDIVINFSSLDFTTPSKNEYAYMLEGVNDFWVYTDAFNRNANYNNLPPGNYTFKVKSSNSDGIWNETLAELHFSISPPFWKSNLAKTIYIILTLLCIYIAYLLMKKWYLLKKNLVAQTVSRQKENEYHKMKMVFFTDISHELRTPLSLILGTIEKTIKEKKFNLSPFSSQRIYNNAQRMQRLINQIMDIRKYDQGKFKLSISRNDIIADIRIIKSAFDDFAKIYSIRFEFITNQKKYKGWYDVDMLEKILFNILSNAFKYTAKGGSISVSVKILKAKDVTNKNFDFIEGDYLECKVKDNGVGILKEDLQYIFNRYYQARKPYSNQIPGTGIGMELVQKLIEKHYGYIYVESEVNKFTEFTFYLPLSKKHYNESEIINSKTPLLKNFIKNSEFQVIEEVSSEFEAKNNKNKPTILLVEDNVELRSMLKDELIGDFYVLEASNGKEGFDLAIKEQPILIISDILMPVEDGIHMLKRLKDESRTKNIPIFMLTAKNSEETKIECLSLGADDYIEKPFSLEFVKWKVKNFTTKRKELKKEQSEIIDTEPSELKLDSHNKKFIKKLILIIEESMDDNLLSVEFLASEVGMSRASLYRKLKDIINETPVNFIKKIKLKRAAQLLKKSDMYISEIAFMTGFNDQKYFGKCFSKEYGMSPTEYIKKHGEKPKRIDIDFS